MSISLTLAFVWVLVASAIAFIPSKRQHWPQAYALIAVGIPILGYVTYENGPMVGVICLIAGGSILRWPVIHAVRWMRGERRKAPGKEAASTEPDCSEPATRPETATVGK